MAEVQHDNSAEHVVSEKKDKSSSDNAPESFGTMTKDDKRAFILLVVLYALQGIPVGLTFGTMPFLLKSHVGYGGLGFFMLSTYPYSIKLLWSPIVDSFFVSSWRIPCTNWELSLGRRKSWIVPVQIIVGLTFIALAKNIDVLMDRAETLISLITCVFFALISLAATQDIAVDGWALTLLSKNSLGYASTAQTIGVNLGYFMSFTVFLALNSVEACNKYLRWTPKSTPILTLSGYLHMCGMAFICVTLWLLFYQKEAKESERMEIRKAYSTIWQICQLRHVQLFLIVHMICKIGYQANDAVTGLKLVERGLGKEDLAFAVLVDFPFQLLFGYLTATWSRGDKALQPWMVAMVFKLLFAAMSMGVVAGMSADGSEPITTSYFLLILFSTILNSFASTVQFVGITAFHTQVADPIMGGTYMTLLNTISNLGGTWPRYFVLKMVDFFTVSMCRPPLDVDFSKIEKMLHMANASLSLGECKSEAGLEHCSKMGGTCATIRDGYFATSTICIGLGVVTFVFFIVPICRRLQRIAPSEWHIVSHAQKKH